MKKRTLAVLGVLLLLVGCIIMTSPVRADWDQGDSAKWVQLPDLTANGVAVLSTGYPLYLILADDFKCTATGPITGIHIWGAYLDDNDFPPDFQLRFWSDVPAGGPNEYSHPGEPLWRMVFTPDKYKVAQYQTLTNPEFFMDPLEPKYLEPGDTEVWQFNFSIDPKEAFKQKEGEIYWLSVEVLNDFLLFGWKSAGLNPDQRWNDDAVYAQLSATDWRPLKYLGPHPNSGESMDLAFVITPIPGSVLLLGTGLLGLAGLRWRFRK